MPNALKALAIDLTDQETALAARIDFEASRQLDVDAMEELMTSLMERGGIPLVRRKFFTDPEYLVGGRGRSRLQKFEDGGTRGADIFRHGNSLKYLHYFLYGPNLPEPVIEAFQHKIISCGTPFTSSDGLDVADFARGLARSYGLDRHKAPDEFYKLALDCAMDVGDAQAVRASVMQLR